MSAEFDLDSFAKKFDLKRLKDFDWAVGDSGKKVCLFQAEQEKKSFEVEGNSFEVEWLSFPLAARKLKTGEDRRLLQLAVQFLSAGGVLQDVHAAEYDKDTLDEISKELLGVSIDDLKK